MLLTSCISGSETLAPPAFITATLPTTHTPSPASTQVLPTSTLAAEEAPIPQQLVQGVTTTQLNLRSGPSTAGETLGTVAAFSTIQIAGKESYGKWYQIVDATLGKGWIIASYVQTNDPGALPIIDLGPSGLVIQGVNVRSGAGQDSASLGTLVANDVILLTGKDSNGDWLQINFKGSPGWVAAEFIQVNNLEIVPMVAGQNEGSVETGPTDPGNPAISIQDHDSLESPLSALTLHPSGAGGLQSSGSIAGGDEADWIQFTTSGGNLSIQVDCPTSSEVRLDLYKNAAVLHEGFLKCNEIKTLNTDPGQPYTLKLGTNAETLNPIPYRVFIKIVR